MSEVKSIESHAVPVCQDRAWHWVKYDDIEAPAMYRVNVDCWYSYEFGGIPTRQLEVLGPCSRLAEQAQEIERLRMQLVACGVVAMANTAESAAKMRDMHPDYMSASCADVIRVVDNEMQLRAELQQLKSRQSGVVLPEPKTLDNGHSDAFVVGYNLCLDEVSRLNPAEQLNKAQGEVYGYWLYPNGYPELGIFHAEPIDSADQDCKVIPLYTAPPSIPETSVVVERELLRRASGLLVKTASMHEPPSLSCQKGVVIRCACIECATDRAIDFTAELRAILSSKGDV